MLRSALRIIIPSVAAFVSAGPVRAAGDGLEDQIWELRIEAEYSAAADVARELLVLKRSDADAKPYEIADAERLHDALEHIASLPEDVQRELARADSFADAEHTLYEEGKYAEAVEALHHQLEIQQEILGDEHLDISRGLNALGANLWALGDYENSEEAYRRSLAIKHKLLGDMHPVVALTMNNLSLISWARGDYGEGEDLSRRALETQRRLLGDEHAEVALTLNNLGMFLEAQGDYESAEAILRRALVIRRKLLGNDHPDVAQGLNNVAYLLASQGDMAGAEPLYREALDIWRRVLGEERSEVAISLTNIAHLLRSRGEFKQAELLCRDALEINRNNLGENHPEVAKNLHNVATMLEEQCIYEEAEKLYREALAMNRRLLGETHPHVANDIESVAGTLEERGDYRGAEELYREALLIRRLSLGEKHPHVAICLTNLGAVLMLQGEYEEAESLLEEAADVYEAARVRAGAGLERAMFQKSPYALLAASRLYLGQGEEAWEAVERDLSRVLFELLVSSDSRHLTESESAYEDSLLSLMSHLERELSAFMEAARSDTSTEAEARVEEARDRLYAAEASLSLFRNEISEKYAVTEGQVYPLERVQASLYTSAAIIGWLDVDENRDRYPAWCYVIRSSGPVHWARAPVDAREGETPNRAIERLRLAIKSPETASLGLYRDARDVWGQRIEPVADALEGVTELVVIPSGAMIGVPVEVLMVEESLSASRVAVSYAPSATIYAWLAEVESTREDAKTITAKGQLLIGDPPFSEEHLEAMTIEKTGTLRTIASAANGNAPEFAVLRNALYGNDDVLVSLPRLPGTRREVEAVASLCPEPLTLVGPDASEQEMVRLALSGRIREFSVIHIATHGIVDDEDYGRSALVFSRANLPDPLESAIKGERIFDGLVTARDVMREWELDADLVTLSSCQSALGQEVPGEGYVGLAHAFLQAGARSLIVSLWKVDDAATSALMERFYENYFGRYEGGRITAPNTAMTKAEALQEAKRRLRSYKDDLGDNPYDHPYFWSAFILVGDRN
jgi:CHAT domain-containing protein/Flp pilus assembly protein TadD